MSLYWLLYWHYITRDYLQFSTKKAIIAGNSCYFGLTFQNTSKRYYSFVMGFSWNTKIMVASFCIVLISFSIVKYSPFYCSLIFTEVIFFRVEPLNSTRVDLYSRQLFTLQLPSVDIVLCICHLVRTNWSWGGISYLLDKNQSHDSSYMHAMDMSSCSYGIFLNMHCPFNREPLYPLLSLLECSSPVSHKCTLSLSK